MAPKAKHRGIKPPNSPVPQPFSPAPAELADLLDTLDKSVVYITHIDTHPAWFKKRIFAVPVLLNLNILALLLWRAWYILPYYGLIFLSILRYHNETTIYYATTPRNELIWKVFKRMLSFMLDFFLVRVVFPWPTSFFIEWPGNPIRWRWNTGFRDEEVYVRQSRSWGAQDLLGVAAGSTGKAGGESPFFKTRILPALDQARLKEKTGYLLMDADFDLDFYGMIAATQLIDRKTISASVLRKAVFVYVGDLTSEVKNGQWCWWDCSPLDEGSETEARTKIVEFKDKLTEMGKESLFFKWVELIQYESNAPGGFTQERQIEAGKKVKKLFEDNGVDFEKLSREIGGIDVMPGT